MTHPDIPGRSLDFGVCFRRMNGSDSCWSVFISLNVNPPAGLLIQ